VEEQNGKSLSSVDLYDNDSELIERDVSSVSEKNQLKELPESLKTPFSSVNDAVKALSDATKKEYKKNGWVNSSKKEKRRICCAANACKFELKLKVADDDSVKFLRWSNHSHSCTHQSTHSQLPESLDKPFDSFDVAFRAIQRNCAEGNRVIKKNGKTGKGDQMIACKKKGSYSLLPSLSSHSLLFFFGKGCGFRCFIHQEKEEEFIVKNWYEHSCSPLVKDDMVKQNSSLPVKLRDFLESLSLDVGMKDIKKSVMTFVQQEIINITWLENDLATYVNAIRKARKEIGDVFLELQQKLASTEGVRLKQEQNKNGSIERLFIVFRSMDDIAERWGAVMSFDATYGKNKYGYPVHFFVCPSNENSSFIVCAALTRSETTGFYVDFLNFLLTFII